MTDNEFLKDLECCSERGNCNRCSRYTIPYPTCKEQLCKSACNLIHILSNNADNAFQEGLNENRELFKNEVKAEIIKEFIEKLIYEIVNRPSENATGGVLYNNGRVDRQNEIIDIINELAGVDFET